MGALNGQSENEEFEAIFWIEEDLKNKQTNKNNNKKTETSDLVLTYLKGKHQREKIGSILSPLQVLDS